MEAGWSARRVARHAGRSDFTVRRCWDQWTRDVTYTVTRLRKPSTDQLSRRRTYYTKRMLTTQRDVHDIHHPHVLPLMTGLPGAIFHRDIALPHYHPSLASSIPRFVTNRAYLGSFGTASWAPYEFGRTRGAFTATVERDVSGHHTELVCLNARSYRIVHSC
ncbi:transposable element Tcb1 transposase [Trichonephila clavipes]|nr:transposable element Tcb1 transposase [Trichonephila clavipes]